MYAGAVPMRLNVAILYTNLFLLLRVLPVWCAAGGALSPILVKQPGSLLEEVRPYESDPL